MDTKRLRTAVETSLKTAQAPAFEEDDLPWQALYDASLKAEEAMEIADTAVRGAERARRSTQRGLGLAKFRQRVTVLVKEAIKSVICNQVYDAIDTPKEREEIAERITDIVLTEVAGKIPGGSLVKGLLKHIVVFFVARGIAYAAENLEAYCEP